MDTTPITIFVGPNNAGKSKVLSEIAAYCKSGQSVTNDVILENIIFEGSQPEKADERIIQSEIKPFPHQGSPPIGHVVVGEGSVRLQFGFELIKNSIVNPNSNKQLFCTYYLSYHTLMLNGLSRTNLINSQSAGDLQEAGQTSLQILFKDDQLRARVVVLFLMPLDCIW
ncbi:hypothetical protein [Leptospira stimsonii]|uniref:hypothetical protein n=1 Tax=Leptospira stimsonii TaxID=2202203 RepID=UPI001AEFB7E7|nr:hypothetical protein [Leptospira stimsonii]